MKRFNKQATLNKLSNKNNSKTKKRTIIISIIVLVIGIIYFSFARFESSSGYSLIKGVAASRDIIIKNIYLGNTPTDNLPGKNSGWAFDHSQCTNDANLTWNNTTWNITIDLTTKTECSLYFKEKEFLRGNANDVLAMFNDYSTTTNVIDLGVNDKLAFDGTTDNNLRYVGAEPLNYVLYNNELWRIIGVMNNVQTESGQTQSLFKIRRAESLGEYSWDTTERGLNYGDGINQWGESTYANGTPYEGADLMRELNTDYLGNITVGTDGKWYNGSYNSKTADMPTSTISSEAQNMIETVVWHLGSPSSNNGVYDRNYSKITADVLYTRERANTHGKSCSSTGNGCNDTVTRTTTWTGKVGLIYVSDYIYAVSGKNENSREICLNNNINDMGYDNDNLCYVTWFEPNTSNIFRSIAAISPVGNNYYSSSVAYASQYGIDDFSSGYTSKIKPVIYLKSNVSIVDGLGSAETPYIIE